MMRRNMVIALRVLETLLLIGVGYTLRRSMAEQTGSFFFLNISLNISVAQHVEEVVLQTTFFGYVISQIATMLTPSEASSKYFRWSLLLSLLGIITFVLELVRFFAGYELRVLFETAAALVFVDWALTHAMLKMPKTAGPPPEFEEPAGDDGQAQAEPDTGDVDVTVPDQCCSRRTVLQDGSAKPERER